MTCWAGGWYDGQMAYSIQAGMLFGKWTVLKVLFDEPRLRGHIAVEVRCACGLIQKRTAAALRAGATSGCPSCSQKRHGHGGTNRSGGESPEYRSWMYMCTRATNPNIACAQYYTGRGIGITPEWLGPGGFEKFFAHIGPRPHGYSVDRIDNDKGYFPGNVRWATATVQARNQNPKRNLARITAFGETLTLAEWQAKTGVSGRMAYKRIRHLGWTPEEAVSTPLIPHSAPRLHPNKGSRS